MCTDWITEKFCVIFRGSRVGMSWKINSPVLETRWSGAEEHLPPRIRKRNRGGLHWESEGFIVPLEGKGQHNPARGKEPCFVYATEERRRRGLPIC